MALGARGVFFCAGLQKTREGLTDVPYSHADRGIVVNLKFPNFQTMLS